MHSQNARAFLLLSDRQLGITDEAEGALEAYMIATIALVGCPECDGQINLSATILKGEIMMCPDCGAELEITATNPLKLELAPMVEEDWGE